jgi:pentapeptide MXKDX repeat protein
MKWMMCSVAMLVAAVLSVAVGAQSDAMAKGDKMGMKDATYTGCIEAGATAGTFVLTHIAADHMGKDTMKKDAMKTDTMKKDTMAKDTMAKDAMAPTTLTLAGAKVDLTKHLGHKVSVTGSAADGKMDAMGKDAMAKDTMKKDTMAKDGMAKEAAAFTVKSLKMVAASCS